MVTPATTTTVPLTEIVKARPDADIAYGNREEISALAKRIKTMLPGGEKLSENESLALAQVATVTKLNPFVGEVWYIPGKGPMVGIKGARRLENEETRNKNGYSWMQFDVISPEDSGAPDPKNVFRAYKCTINDVNATKAYLAVFHDALEMLRGAQSKDPYMEAKEICGPRPVWEGYGFSLIGEPSRMNPDALARKRAEADALKKRIVLPFGTEVSPQDSDFIEGEITEVAKPESVAVSIPVPASSEAQIKDSPVQKVIREYSYLCIRADAVKVPHEPMPENVTIDQARAIHKELLEFVRNAEAQAKAEQPGLEA